MPLPAKSGMSSMFSFRHGFQEVQNCQDMSQEIGVEIWFLLSIFKLCSLGLALSDSLVCFSSALFCFAGNFSLFFASLLSVLPCFIVFFDSLINVCVL